MNNPKEWGISLSDFDNADAKWGRLSVNRPEVNSGSIYFDNLPIYQQKGLLGSDGKYDKAKLESNFYNKAMQVISAIEKARFVLTKGDIFPLLPDIMKEKLRYTVLQVIDFALSNSFKEKVVGNNITTNGLGISDNLSGWITSGSMFGTIAWNTLMTSKIHLITFDKETNTIEYDGERIVIEFKTKEILGDTEIDTDNQSSLQTKKRIVQLIGDAVSGSKVEIITTDDINNMTNYFDKYIKEHSKLVHTIGDVIDIQYDGGNSIYKPNNNGIIESYVFDGANYQIITNNIAVIDKQAEQDGIIKEIDLDKADANKTILIDGSNKFDNSYTPSNDNDAEKVASVKAKISLLSDEIKGGSDKTIKQLENVDEDYGKRIENLEDAGVSAYLDGVSQTEGNNQLFTNHKSTDTDDDKALGFKSGEYYGTLEMPNNVNAPGWNPTIPGSTEPFTYNRGEIFEIEIYNKLIKNTGTPTFITVDEAQGNTVSIIDNNVYIYLYSKDPRPNKQTPLIVIGNIDDNKESDFTKFGIGRLLEHKAVAKNSVPNKQDLADLKTDLDSELNNKVDTQQAPGVLVKGIYSQATTTSALVAKVNEHSNNIVGTDLQGVVQTDIIQGETFNPFDNNDMISFDRDTGKPRRADFDASDILRKSTEIKFYEGQILSFKQEKLDTKFEDTNLFEKSEVPNNRWIDISTQYRDGQWTENDIGKKIKIHHSLGISTGLISATSDTKLPKINVHLGTKDNYSNEVSQYYFSSELEGWIGSLISSAVPSKGIKVYNKAEVIEKFELQDTQWEYTAKKDITFKDMDNSVIETNGVSLNVG